jgi:hypothetical protein
LGNITFKTMVMQQSNLLNKFDYKSYHPVQVIGNAGLKLNTENPLPFLEAKVDLAAGKLSLQADSRFIFRSAENRKRKQPTVQADQVYIQMDIQPTAIIDLNDHSNNGRMFSLEGIITDASLVDSCIGAIILKTKSPKQQDSNHWLLEIYVYDNAAYYGEIKFDLPLYLTKEWKNN